jgi:hypothetical protein
MTMKHLLLANYVLAICHVVCNAEGDARSLSIAPLDKLEASYLAS